MIKTTHGKVHGKTIELDEDLGLAEGQMVEIQVRAVESDATQSPEVRAGMSGIYAVLGERYESGHTDTAERHNEHQP